MVHQTAAGGGPSGSPKMTVSPKLHTVYELDAKHQHKAWGIFQMLTYLLTWMTSLASPLIIFTLFYFKFTLLATVLCLITASAYLYPYKKSRLVQDFLLVPYYFKECSYHYEKFPPFEAGKDAPTILCVHPHGVFCMGWAQVFCRSAEELAGFYFCFSSVLNMSPFFRILTRLLADTSNVDKDSMLALMRQKKNLALNVGGFEDASIHTQDKDRIFLKNRKGFVKYALQHGYSLTPAYIFGEHQTYWNMPGFYKFRLWLNSFGLPGIVPFGVWWCPILPKDVPIHTVVSTPLVLPKIENPTPGEVDKWHTAYVLHLTQLYDRYKVRFYGPEAKDRQLEIW
eukprot:GDKI01010160.1.p1 GENE.GDKI01010160.1~~GDKI01010160.1.p1  ORF type:complete len:340 (+),score=33.82 GDKI01010160.1:51-1070(+)